MAESVEGHNGEGYERSDAKEQHICPIDVCFLFNLALNHINLTVLFLRTIVYTMSLRHE